MTFSSQTLSILALLALGLSLLAVLVAFAAASRRQRREPGGPLRLEPVLQGVLDGQAEQLAKVDRVLRALHSTDRRQEEAIRAAVSRVALLRYDAFEDVGGRLSFSCALLDDHGTGVVLTAINGRQETRVYAKPVTEGRSSHNLSLEEDEAIRQAIAAPRP
jgi:hypothetical protein